MLTSSLTNDILILVVAITSKKLRQKSLKNLKKVVDKVRTAWYDIKVAAEQSDKTANKFADEPWQINSNATLKIPNKNFREQIRFERIDPNKTVRSRNVCSRVICSRYKWKASYSGEEQLFNMRVWSWLRMNAGGVPNTCKSNGLNET